MANSLKRNLKVSDKVVLLGGDSVEIAIQTFGTMSFTSGTALAVRRIGSTEDLRCSGYDIDAEETLRRYGAENGWNSHPNADAVDGDGAPLSE